MVVVADASVAIRGDLSGFHRDLKGAEVPVQTLGQKLKGIFSPANIIGAAGVLGVAVGVRQLVSYAGEAAQAFSDLEQTGRTVDAVFGDSADTITEWGERAAEAAGLSKREVNEAAAVMGQTLLNMGFDAEDAADKVVLLQQRAADLALAFGKDPEDAILAITAAMRGERDTIEKFGVSIKQADVNARILALGLDTSTASAKKNSEAIAILDIILSQSASSAGRFADSQDDVAVKLAQNQARIENMNAEIGQAVASIQLGAAKVGEASASELDKFATHFGDQAQTIIRLAEEAGVSFDVMQQRIFNAMDLSGLTFPEVVATFSVEGVDVSDQVEEEYMAAALAAGAGVAAMAREMELGGPVVAAEAGKIAGMLPSEIKARDAEIRAAGRENIVQFALGMLEKQNDPLLAMEVLARANEEALTRSAEITRLLGQLHSTELANGLNDGRPEVRLAAAAARSEIEERLRDLNAWPWGYNVGSTLASGMNASQYLVRNASYSLASATGQAITIRSEPPDRNSPLYGITQWGGNIVKTLAEGIYGELGTGAAASRALAGALSPSLPDSWTPGQQGGPGMPLGVGHNVQYILYVEGLPVLIGSAEDVMERWKQMTSLSRDGVQ
jgi:hypothetical protein